MHIWEMEKGRNSLDHLTAVISGRSLILYCALGLKQAQAHNTRPYSVNKRTIAYIHKRLYKKVIKSLMVSVHGHGDLGSQEQRGVLKNLNRSETLQCSKSVTHTLVKQAVLCQ